MVPKNISDTLEKLCFFSLHSSFRSKNNYAIKLPQKLSEMKTGIVKPVLRKDFSINILPFLNCVLTHYKIGKVGQIGNSSFLFLVRNDKQMWHKAILFKSSPINAP